MRRPPPKYNPTGVSTHQSAEQTNDPLIADHRNFYKVEKWIGVRWSGFKARTCHWVQASLVTCQPFRDPMPSDDLE